MNSISTRKSKQRIAMSIAACAKTATKFPGSLTHLAGLLLCCAINCLTSRCPHTRVGGSSRNGDRIIVPFALVGAWNSKIGQILKRCRFSPSGLMVIWKKNVSDSFALTMRQCGQSAGFAV
ncbi:MAG: hypothetical protein JWQ87_2954 [Candidatus Sulfotelmatobacter sp.]|nr:hypothetical protein [Candidatus Sulfotelmatobacter sp.]